MSSPAPPAPSTTETHRTTRIGWLRASVLGANDGIVSTASVVVGVASSGAPPSLVFVAGLSSLVAGALSMAAGEYVSVSSQADTEAADLAIERRELATRPAAEEAELAAIYESRGLTPELAHQVATALMQHDALGAHARDELGHSAHLAARPLQAAFASAGSFAVGAVLPVAVAVAAPAEWTEIAVGVVSVLCLIVLGATAASAGGASPVAGAARVSIWGVVAMAATALVGWLTGVSL